jgi:hypothetical protein
MKKEFAYKILYNCGCKIISYEYDDDIIDEYTLF